jgi:H/ACA ribonucleoprotein complex subunit 1
MGKEFNDRGGSAQRGGFRGGSGGFRGGSGGSRGGPGNFRGGSGGRGGPRGNFDQGPPSYVVPYATFLHKSESSLVLKCTDLARFPKFNRGIYLENKAKVGSVDEIFGPVNAFYFSVKPVDGVDAKNFKEGQVFYINPEDLLSTDRFTKPQAPRPKGPRGPPGQGTFGRPQGGQRGGFAPRGGFSQRGGGAPRGGFNNRGQNFRR